MASHNEFGKKAEEAAAQYLTQKGYKVLIKNYRFQKAELDIVAEYGELLIIVEVKARTKNIVMEPYEAVDFKKKRNTLTAANHFAEEYNIAKEIRFDILSMLETKAGDFHIQHLENAFEAHDIS